MRFILGIILQIDVNVSRVAPAYIKPINVPLQIAKCCERPFLFLNLCFKRPRFIYYHDYQNERYNYTTWTECYKLQVPGDTWSSHHSSLLCCGSGPSCWVCNLENRTPTVRSLSLLFLDILLTMVIYNRKKPSSDTLLRASAHPNMASSFRWL